MTTRSQDRQGTPAKAAWQASDLNTPTALELAESQWAIKLADGRVIPTGAGQERTQRDAEWENTSPDGRGGCSVVVRDSYRTPWRLADSPGTDVEAVDQAAAAQELTALHAQVAHLTESLVYYRHAAMGQAASVDQGLRLAPESSSSAPTGSPDFVDFHRPFFRSIGSRTAT